MDSTPSEFDLSQSQSQFTQTQPQTQPQSQSQQQSRWPDHLFGLLVPVSDGSSTSFGGHGYSGGAAGAHSNGAGGRAPRLELNRSKNTWMVGRHPRCDLVLNGPKISSWHAKIELGQDGIVRLHDTSTNGTFVGGSKVGKNNVTILESGASIVFGPVTGSIDTDFRYVFEGAPATSASVDPYGLGELSQADSGIFNDYEVREQLGKGSFAVVRKGVRRSDGKMVAIKIIQKARFSGSPQTLMMFQREIQIVKTLEHQFCVRCFDFYEDEQRIWLVLEYVDGGDLLDYVMKRGGLKEAEVREIALMVCQAVAYLHSKGITHRDLKPENLLLTKGAKPQCKVTDFGLAKMVDDQTRLQTMCGTPTYLAPEVILQNQSGMGYRDIVDAYSIGVILYSCLTNQTPFDESESTPLQERMKFRSVDLNIPRSMGVSEVALDFLGKLLENNPNRRMSCKQALEHPWLRIKDKSSTDSLPFSLGSSLPFNSGTAGDMGPPASRGAKVAATVNGNGAGVEADGDVSALQSAASLTSPAMSTRVRDDQEDSMVDSQGFGNLRIHQSEASVTTPDTSAAVSSAEPSAPMALAPLPESTERVSDYGLSPQIAGQKRKTMASHFSDSSLSELPSQPSQDLPTAPVMEVDFALEEQKRRALSNGMSIDAAVEGEKEVPQADSTADMSGVEVEEKEQPRPKDPAGDETDDREPSTTEETDVVPDKLVKSPISPRTTRRTSRGGSVEKKVVVTPARARKTRASSAATPTSVGGSAASASPEQGEEGGIAASVKNRRRKAARLN
ncbi:hypothetical protein JCM6882_002730 [Rhodosporidiobolus microsporus]